MITDADVVLALSNSGETDEVLTLLPVFRRQGNRLIAMTGRANSSMAREADVHLDVSVPAEACPLALAPTSSTTASLAMGDALAVALLEARGFTADDFARSHPAGALADVGRVVVEMAVWHGDSRFVVSMGWRWIELSRS
jgi:arabinose-5-phosphate isomerase